MFKYAISCSKSGIKRLEIAGDYHKHNLGRDSKEHKCVAYSLSQYGHLSSFT